MKVLIRIGFLFTLAALVMVLAPLGNDTVTAPLSGARPGDSNCDTGDPWGGGDGGHHCGNGYCEYRER